MPPFFGVEQARGDRGGVDGRGEEGGVLMAGFTYEMMRGQRNANHLYRKATDDSLSSQLKSEFLTKEDMLH